MESEESYIDDFLRSSFKTNDYRLLPLAGDASNRRYYRIVRGSQSWVLMRWDPFKEENYPFLSVLRHFQRSQVNVPEVVDMSPTAGLVILEDLGDLTLERRFWENQNQEASLAYYQMAMDELIKIHYQASQDREHACTAFGIQFDTDKLLWEMNYGKDNLILGVLNFNLSLQSHSALQKVFLNICTRLDEEPKYIAHRDYHSRNLMIKLDKMRVIDFQDARMGPIQYDLVSLLKDSYVEMSEDISGRLINYYLDRAKEFLPSNFSREHFDAVYEIQTLQRCFKACGSFASFFHQRQDRRYLKYLGPTLKRVVKTLIQFPEYKVFGDILIDSGALEKKFETL